VRLRVHLQPGSSVIDRVSWEGQGCSISQASISVMADLVDGTSVETAEELGATFRELMRARGRGLDDDSEDRLGDATAFTGVAQYPARIKCALLGWAALRDALVRAGALQHDATEPTDPPSEPVATGGTQEENR
ncbi:MAG: SUF system NifU family Fe-S cluster assembly protein, partial [Cellulomonadaceae bacterium]|nr:SUF system NifU family Fe-S cluster assembly protein [Cellulomonadaceae bacterium]